MKTAVVKEVLERARIDRVIEAARRWDSEHREVFQRNGLGDCCESETALHDAITAYDHKDA